MNELLSFNEGLKKHIVDNLKKSVRTGGRKLTEFREVTVERGCYNTAEGSSRVKIGETEVLAGIKLSVGTPYPDAPDAGTLMVGSELLPLSSPAFESGPPSIMSIELSRVIDRGIREAKAIDTKKLCIEVGEKVWIVSIDICTINDAGNLLDASGIAALAALQDAVYPTYDGTLIDYKKKTKDKLPLTKLPLLVTIYKVGETLLVDPTLEEEQAFDARLTVTTTEDGKLCALQKGGEEPLTIDEVNKMVELGIEKANELRKKL